MSDSHDEIKKLIKASQNMLNTDMVNETIVNIKEQYGIINEQSVNLTDTENDDKIDVGQDVADEIEFETKPKKDKRQAYRISGGIIVLHGKDKKDLFEQTPPLVNPTVHSLTKSSFQSNLIK